MSSDDRASKRQKTSPSRSPDRATTRELNHITSNSTETGANASPSKQKESSATGADLLDDNAPIVLKRKIRSLFLKLKERDHECDALREERDYRDAQLKRKDHVITKIYHTWKELQTD